MIGINKPGGIYLIKINKKNFLDKFNDEDSGIISNIYDKIVLSERTGKTIFSEYFFTPNIWKKLLEIQDYINISITLYGVFDHAERRMIAFNKEQSMNFPVKLLSIRNLSRFSTSLHKDYLGSLMALGIKREKLGDLICYDDYGVVPVCEDIHEYIKLNLNAIGKSPCSVEVLDPDSFVVPISLFSEMVVNCASSRLDAVVGSLCNISRSNSSELITSGKVIVDYCECCIKDKKVEESSVITVRGFGKFIIGKEVGFTKSGNLKLKVKKYK